MLLGIIITPLITLIAPAKDTDRVNSIFSCYDKKVTASSKKYIGDEEESIQLSKASKTSKNVKAKKSVKK